ncbi:predicted protein [Pyrenophora tritici-repentis Pt-1C-BFP]|uniref:Uncharacterized protein n=1 Tax=Pyrenophora tritici-repentis (strain Pt-1C-BFP) TaxID=426418 RepID=B2W5L3_PYRTR|nr:uncharacterized protein PTRG_04913 [Pyrenophora tritici-repentis Pt-1C-BFP]EDU47820.1 predicted protein [Pyrenophora tritici-repentis Pt-1C-BFP]
MGKNWSQIRGTKLFLMPGSLCVSQESEKKMVAYGLQPRPLKVYPPKLSPAQTSTLAFDEGMRKKLDDNLKQEMWLLPVEVQNWMTMQSWLTAQSSLTAASSLFRPSR